MVLPDGLDGSLDARERRQTPEHPHALAAPLRSVGTRHTGRSGLSACVTQMSTLPPNIILTAVQILGGPSEAARELGVSRSQIYRWIRLGRMGQAETRHTLLLSQQSGVDIQYLSEGTIG